MGKTKFGATAIAQNGCSTKRLISAALRNGCEGNSVFQPAFCGAIMACTLDESILDEDLFLEATEVKLGIVEE
jgi:hypothetical protein